MNIVVLDYACLPSGVDFPPLALDRYGWEQYPRLPAGEVTERCWRADVIVTLATPVSAAQLKQLGKLKLIVAGAREPALTDLAAAQERGIAVRTVALPQGDDASAAEGTCREVVANIEAFLRGEPRNRVG